MIDLLMNKKNVLRGFLMKNNILYYDSIVIGAGPAGLFSALELLKKNKNIAVIEKGGQFIESLCPSIRKNLNTFHENSS